MTVNLERGTNLLTVVRMSLVCGWQKTEQENVYTDILVNFKSLNKSVND